MDRDQAEAARRERIAEHGVDARADARRPARSLRTARGRRPRRPSDPQIASSRRSRLSTGDSQKRVALLRRPRRAPARLTARASSSDGRHSPARAPRSARGRGRRCRARRACPRSSTRSRGAGVSACHCSGTAQTLAAVVDVGDPQHRDFRHAARLVEGAAGRAVDQPLVGHVLEQALERDLVLPRQPERPRNLALARRLVGRGDEVEDLLAAGKAGAFVSWAITGHEVALALFVELHNSARPRAIRF